MNDLSICTKNGECIECYNMCDYYQKSNRLVFICKHLIFYDKLLCSNFMAWPDEYVRNNILYASGFEYLKEV